MMQNSLTWGKTDLKIVKVVRKKSISAIALVSNLGLSISLPIIAGAFVGNFLDTKLKLSPVITLSLILLGVILGISNMFFLLKEESKR